MLKRKEQQKLVAEINKAITKQESLVRGWNKETNPQIVKMKHIAVGKHEALVAVIDVLNGHPDYLLKIMGD